MRLAGLTSYDYELCTSNISTCLPIDGSVSVAKPVARVRVIVVVVVVVNPLEHFSQIGFEQSLFHLF